MVYIIQAKKNSLLEFTILQFFLTIDSKVKQSLNCVQNSGLVFPKWCFTKFNNKDVLSIKITTIGRETRGRSQGHVTVFMTRILFLFFYYILH